MSGPEHPETLAVWKELAYWTGEAGDAAAARDELAALVPVCERVLGPEHPDTLTCRHHLANFTGYAGDAAAAGTSSPRCCRPASVSWARITLTPWPREWNSRPGPAAPGTRRGPVISSPRC